MYAVRMATDPSKIKKFFKNEVAKKGNSKDELVFDESTGELTVKAKRNVKNTDRKVHLKMNKFFCSWSSKRDSRWKRISATK